MAVIVTSGTATANLYPALIEAGLTGEKLIQLTADRPPELIDCGANQAIRQPGMFCLPSCADDFFAASLAGYSCPLAGLNHRPGAGALHAGGVHINCPFAEPLYGDMDETGVEWQPAARQLVAERQTWLRQALQLESEEAARLVLLATKNAASSWRAE